MIASHGARSSGPAAGINPSTALLHANGSTRLWKGMSYPQWRGSSSSGGGGGSSGVRHQPVITSISKLAAL